MNKTTIKRISQEFTNHPKIGDVYVAKCGYNMRFYKFVEVKKVLNKMIIVQELEKNIIDGSNGFQPIVSAGTKLKGLEKRVKIIAGNNHFKFKIGTDYYGKWQGQNLQENLCD